MSPHDELASALAAIAAGLNEHDVDELDVGRVQHLVAQVVGGRPALTVDDGGGLHDASGVRVGAIRRTDSGEWITERQNEDAWRADEEIPSPPPLSRLRGLLTRLHVRG